MLRVIIPCGNDKCYSRIGVCKFINQRSKRKLSLIVFMPYLITIAKRNIYDPYMICRIGKEALNSILKLMFYQFFRVINC